MKASKQEVEGRIKQRERTYQKMQQSYSDAIKDFNKAVDSLPSAGEMFGYSVVSGIVGGVQTVFGSISFSSFPFLFFDLFSLLKRPEVAYDKSLEEKVPKPMTTNTMKMILHTRTQIQFFSKLSYWITLST